MVSSGKIKYRLDGNYELVYSTSKKKVIKFKYEPQRYNIFVKKYHVEDLYGEKYLKDNFSFMGERCLERITPILLGAEKSNLFSTVLCILGADKIYI